MKASHLLITLAVLVLIAPCAFAGVLRIGVPVFQGELVSVPILLSSDDSGGVCAISFRVDYDPSVFQPAKTVTGAAAAAANKTAQSNVSAPGQCNVIIMGLNQNVMSSGEVAVLALNIVARPEGGRSPLVISETSFSTAQGTAIASQGEAGFVDFSSDEEPADAAQAAADTSGATNDANQPGHSAFQTPTTDNAKTESAQTPPVPVPPAAAVAGLPAVPIGSVGIATPEQQAKLAEALADLERTRGSVPTVAPSGASAGDAITASTYAATTPTATQGKTSDPALEGGTATIPSGSATAASSSASQAPPTREAKGIGVVPGTEKTAAVAKTSPDKAPAPGMSTRAIAIAVLIVAAVLIGLVVVRKRFFG